MEVILTNSFNLLSLTMSVSSKTDRDEGLSTPWERTISDLDTFRPGSKLNDSHAVGTVEEDDQQRSIDRENDSAQQMGEGCCTYGDCRRGCAQRTSRTSVEMRSEGGLTCVDCLLQGGSDRNKTLESDSFKRNMNNQTTTGMVETDDASKDPSLW